MAASHPTLSPAYRRALPLAAILVLGAALRLFSLGAIPPGLSVDEASNVWNAHSLLETGRDEHGAPWPVLYTRAFGENRSTSYVYAVLPFEAIGGMRGGVVRLPAALSGIAAIWLLYWIGARLFDAGTGLAAAALLAINPWHLQVSRWALEASLAPLLILGSFAAILWAGLLEGKGEGLALRAGLAGFLCAASCYGYWAVRMFLPLFLATIALVEWRAFRRRATEPGRLRSPLTFAGAFLATIAPLALRHATDAAMLARRGLTGLAWSPDDSILVRVAKVGMRYAGHFGPDFLFLRGDRFPPHSLPGTGVFQPYALPLVVVGLLVVLTRSGILSRAAGTDAMAPGSSTGKILVAWLLLYPVGDLLKDHPGSHLLRSLPGLPVLALLGGLGLVRTLRFLRERGPKAMGLGTALLVLAALILDGRFLFRFYGSLNREASRYHGNQVDLTEACLFLRPRLSELDAIFFTTRGYSFPYITTLVGLGYEPERWQVDSKEYVSDGEWEICKRYGKVSFLYDRKDYDAVRELLGNERRERVALIARPGELPLQQAGVPPHRILDPEGKPTLEVYILDL